MALQGFCLVSFILSFLKIVSHTVFRIASRDRYLAEFEKAGLLYELDGADLWFCVRVSRWEAEYS